MMLRWVLPVIVLAVIGLGIAGAIWGDGDWGHHDVVTRSVSADGTETIVVHDGHGGFFPFGFLIFPFGFFLFFWIFRAFAFRGRWGRGPWGPGGPGAGSNPGWFDEWHRRAHGETGPPSSSGTNPPATE
jgi:hypothetical protein